jgi:hypothetical protein
MACIVEWSPHDLDASVEYGSTEDSDSRLVTTTSSVERSLAIMGSPGGVVVVADFIGHDVAPILHRPSRQRPVDLGNLLQRRPVAMGGDHGLGPT